MGLDSFLYALETKTHPRLLNEEEFDKEATEIGYWRKFYGLNNRINLDFHDEFDNCKFIHLTKSYMQNLLEDFETVCKELKKFFKDDDDDDNDFYLVPEEVIDAIEKLFPDTFNTYFALFKIQNAIEIFENAIKLADQGYRIYYFAWW